MQVQFQLSDGTIGAQFGKELCKEGQVENDGPRPRADLKSIKSRGCANSINDGGKLFSVLHFRGKLRVFVGDLQAQELWSRDYLHVLRSFFNDFELLFRPYLEAAAVEVVFGEVVDQVLVLAQAVVLAVELAKSQNRIHIVKCKIEHLQHAVFALGQAHLSINF